MKKIFCSAVALCVMAFSGVSHGSDVDKIIGCWNIMFTKFGNSYKVVEIQRDTYVSGPDKFPLKISTDDKYVILHIDIKELDFTEIRYILKDSITDNSFRDSNKKETNPTSGVLYGRTECPKK